MNRDHLYAFVWLRWRLKVNQLRRGGAGNVIVLGVVATLLAVAALGAAATGFAAGYELLDGAPAPAVMLAWDGAVGALLFVWLAGMVASVQRAEGMALDKVMHLPVSPAGAFAVNYLSSLANLTLGVFVPALVAFAVGLACSRGAVMLLALPLLAAFVFALTAVTYQFQGWLASMMTNPRRRRTVAAVAVCGLMVLAQAPQALNVALMGGTGEAREAGQAVLAEMAAAEGARAEANGQAEAEFAAGRLSAEEYRARLGANTLAYDTRVGKSNEAYNARLNGGKTAAKAEQNRARVEAIARTAWVANAVAPPGWLPLGAGSLAEGNPLPALLGAAGFAAIGLASLRRAYRATLRMFSGADADTGAAPAPEAAVAKPRGPEKLSMAEWRFPLVSESASAVAAAGLRSLLRAPETKMVLIAPLMLAGMFGAILATTPAAPPELLRPMLAGFGAGIVLFAALQLVGAQFGYDRGGFRAYVLSPVSRRDILLGKNLAAAPIVLGMQLLCVLAVGVALPMRPDHLLAAALLAAALYPAMALLANALSVLVPVAIAPGTIQPGGMRLTQVLGNFAAMLLFPVVAAPSFLPLGLEWYLAEFAGLDPRVPVALLGSVIVLALTLAVYWRLLGLQGRMLWEREQEVLRVVTSKEE